MDNNLETLLIRLKKMIELYEISSKLDFDKIQKLQEENQKLKDELNLK